MLKALYIVSSPEDRDSCVFSVLTDSEKSIILDLCLSLNIQNVFISDIISPDNKKTNNLLVYPHKSKWVSVSIQEALNSNNIIYNLEWLLAKDFTIKTKTKAKALCKLDSRFISKIPLRLIKDKKFLLDVLDDKNLNTRNNANIEAQSGYEFHYLEDVLDLYNDDKEIALKCINTDPTNYVFVSNTLKRDRDIVTATVKGDARIFQFVGSIFQDDFDIAVASWQNDEEETFNHMSDRLKIMWFWGHQLKYKE